MGYTFSQLPWSTGFPEVLGVSHRQTDRDRGGRSASFRLPSAASRASLLPASLWSMLYSLTTLLLSHLSVIHTPPCLFRPLAHGTLFLSNPSATVTLCACSVSVIYDSNTQTNFFDFHYPVIFISQPLSWPHTAVVTSWHILPLKSHPSINQSLTTTSPRLSLISLLLGTSVLQAISIPCPFPLHCCFYTEAQ